HAARARMIDDILEDDGYLLHADLIRLIPLADQAATLAGQQRAQLLRLTTRASGAGPTERSALLSVTETIEALGSAFTANSAHAPYRARWATAAPRLERYVLEGHDKGATSCCALASNSRIILATASRDRTVRIWDLATGVCQAILQGHGDVVTSVSFYND